MFRFGNVRTQSSMDSNACRASELRMEIRRSDTSSSVSTPTLAHLRLSSRHSSTSPEGTLGSPAGSELSLPPIHMSSPPSPITLPSYQELSEFTKGSIPHSDIPDGRDLLWSSPLAPSLSIFNTATATFAWPRLQAASVMQRPVIYVNYEASRARTPLMNSPSVDVADSSARVRKTTILCNELREKHIPPDSGPKQSSHHRTRDSPASQGAPTHPKPDFAQTSNGETASQPYGGNKGTAESTQKPKSTEPEKMPAKRKRKSKSEVMPTKENSPPSESGWEKFTREERGSDGENLLRCLLTKSAKNEEGETEIVHCGYHASRSLVKRHIEGTHMQLKPHECDRCKKRFPQKTSLDIHIRAHEKSYPLVCKYGCGERFRDPSKQHRHYTADHGYIPRPGKKRKQNS